MSSADKSKLDGIATNANNYTHPATHPASIITQDASNRFVSDTEKSTWNGKASTVVATTSANGLMSSSDKTKLDGVATGANNYVHPATHSITEITGLQTTLDAKADDSTVVKTVNNIAPVDGNVTIEVSGSGGSTGGTSAFITEDDTQVTYYKTNGTSLAMLGGSASLFGSASSYQTLKDNFGFFTQLSTSTGSNAGFQSLLNYYHTKTTLKGQFIFALTTTPSRIQMGFMNTNQAQGNTMNFLTGMGTKDIGSICLQYDSGVSTAFYINCNDASGSNAIGYYLKNTDNTNFTPSLNCLYEFRIEQKPDNQLLVSLTETTQAGVVKTATATINNFYRCAGYAHAAMGVNSTGNNILIKKVIISNK